MVKFISKLTVIVFVTFLVSCGTETKPKHSHDHGDHSHPHGSHDHGDHSHAHGKHGHGAHEHKKEESSKFIALPKTAKSVILHVTSGYNLSNSSMNFNGYAKGEAGFVVPKGWTVHVYFVNKSPTPHSFVIVDVEKVKSLDVGTPVFANASSVKYKIGSPKNKEEKVTFVADKLGDYALACGVPSHASAGHWIGFKVIEESGEASFERKSK